MCCIGAKFKIRYFIDIFFVEVIISFVKRSTNWYSQIDAVDISLSLKKYVRSSWKCIKIKIMKSKILKTLPISDIVSHVLEGKGEEKY